MATIFWPLLYKLPHLIGTIDRHHVKVPHCPNGLDCTTQFHAGYFIQCLLLSNHNSTEETKYFGTAQVSVNVLVQLQEEFSFDIFSFLHRACCRFTQLLHQPMHVYKIYKRLHIKTLKTLRNVSGLTFILLMSTIVDVPHR